MKMIATSPFAIVRVGTAERAVCVVPQPSRGERPGATRGLRRMHRDEYSPVQSSTVQYRPARESSTVQSSPVSSSLLSMMVSATNLRQTSSRQAPSSPPFAASCVYREHVCSGVPGVVPFAPRGPRPRARARAFVLRRTTRSFMLYIARWRRARVRYHRYQSCTGVPRARACANEISTIPARPRGATSEGRHRTRLLQSF